MSIIFDIMALMVAILVLGLVIGAAQFAFEGTKYFWMNNEESIKKFGRGVAMVLLFIGMFAIPMLFDY